MIHPKYSYTAINTVNNRQVKIKIKVQTHKTKNIKCRVFHTCRDDLRRMKMMRNICYWTQLYTCVRFWVDELGCARTESKENTGHSATAYRVNKTSQACRNSHKFIIGNQKIKVESIHVRSKYLSLSNHYLSPCDSTSEARTLTRVKK